MKIKRIISLLIVAVMVCGILASCGGKLTAKVKVTFVAVVDENGETIVDENGKPEELTIGGPIEVTVEGTEKNPPTVLKAAELALAELDFEEGYALTDDGYSIARIKNYAEDQSEDDTTGYFNYWVVYVNGARSVDNGGRQSIIQAYEDDDIVFKFVHDSRAREDKETYDAEKETD